MYLSRVAIDTKKYDTMKALYNMQIFHGMVEKSFSGERQRKLWRLDTLGGTDYLLLLSDTPPENETLPNQIGFEYSCWETKAYDKLLTSIKKGSKWRFRLTANPTVSIMREGKQRGKVKAITIAEKQREWLKSQGIKRGFFIENDSFDVVKSEWKTFKKERTEINILGATFEGILTVIDEELFIQTLKTGIGREKAYGMGLLTVIPYV